MRGDHLYGADVRSEELVSVGKWIVYVYFSLLSSALSFVLFSSVLLQYLKKL